MTRNDARSVVGMLSVQKTYSRPVCVAENLNCSRRTIWRYVKTLPDFPKPLRLAPSIVVFDDDEVDAWVRARKAEREVVERDEGEAEEVEQEDADAAA